MESARRTGHCSISRKKKTRDNYHTEKKTPENVKALEKVP